MADLSNYYRVHNPPETNGLPQPYHLDTSILIFGGIGIFNLNFIFDEIHVSKQNSRRWDAVLAASYLGLFCLPMFHKKDARLIPGLRSNVDVFRDV